MERFSKRQRDILTAISDSDTPVTGNVLSLMLDISLRLIQSEIASINRILPIVHSSNKGYRINPDSWKSLTLRIPETAADDNISHSILKKLIFSTSPYQIDEFAESLFISRSTLEKHIKSFQDILSKFQLNLGRENTYIQINGSELNKRRLIKSLLYDEINPAFNSIDNLSTYFPEMDVDKIKSILANSIHKYNYFVDSTYYNNILINVIIALYRVKSDNYIETSPDSQIRKDSDEYKIAKEIYEQYANHCHIKPEDNDIIALSSILEGQIKPIDSNGSDMVSQDILPEQFISDINDILRNIFNYYMLDIDYSDYLYNFALHIDGMIKRAKNTQSVENEILNTIKRNCPFIYDVSVFVAQRIHKKFHVEIADSEIGFISIHLGYLIEAACNTDDKVSVLLLCDSYHHIYETLEKKIKENFSDMIHILAFRDTDAKTVINTSSDLIITTKPLNTIGRKNLVISPFYTMMDHINITNAINDCAEEKKRDHYNKLLSSLFDENLFFRQDDFDGKEAVIRFLGQKIIEFGLANEGFTESVLQRERLSSTCFFDTFAIPHAIDMDAKRTMFCVLTSPKGILWDGHNIHIVLMIAVQQSDRKKFMELYNGVVRTLGDPKKVQKLVLADNLIDFVSQFIN